MTKFEPVIGLEIHLQLDTKTKAFSSESYQYGKEPNTTTSTVSLGLPGTLPRPNMEHILSGIKMGLACYCNITEKNYYARKNYFYADLPKGYQISQHNTPLCTNGYITIDDPQNKSKTKNIKLTRIHVEEDTGKSLHDLDPFHSLIDLNRAGVPLLEVVSEPDFTNSDEAYNFLQEVRRMVRYLDISNGNMEEGSLRCDANISIKPLGQKEFGTKVEIKNMNSMTHVKKAIEFEIKRQTEVLNNGGKISQETRQWDATSQSTLSLRSKEDAQDYRYFIEPDLPLLLIEKNTVEKVKTALPLMPRELFDIYVNKHKLTEYDAQNLIENKEIAYFFNKLVQNKLPPKNVANWIMGPIKSYLNENSLELSQTTINIEQTSQIINFIIENKISFSMASQKLFPETLAFPNESISTLSEKLNIIQDNNTNSVLPIIEELLQKYPDKVAEYKNGKKGILGLFMGEIMKTTKGKVNPKEINLLLIKKLDG